jgi:hypothetical protein
VQPVDTALVLRRHGPSFKANVAGVHGGTAEKKEAWTMRRVSWKRDYVIRCGHLSQIVSSWRTGVWQG